MGALECLRGVSALKVRLLGTKVDLVYTVFIYAPSSVRHVVYLKDIFNLSLLKKLQSVESFYRICLILWFHADC